MLRLPSLIPEVTSPSSGLLLASRIRTVTSWSLWFAGCETDQNGYKLELMVPGCEIEQAEEFLNAGLRKTALGFSEFEGFEGKFIPKRRFKERHKFEVK